MSLCGNVDAAGIRMPLHRFAGTIRRNKHRDDRAHGRLQNPLAQNDVRAAEPSRRWEARWNKWKGQALAKRPDGFRRRIPHLGVRAGKSHLINGLLRQPGHSGDAEDRARRDADGDRVF